MSKLFMDRERLQEVRNNADWKAVFAALNLQKDERRSKPDDWWAFSPFSEEKTPSFHMNEKGFYDFSAKEKGGVVELVQKVVGLQRGKILDCYEAGRWLVENGISFFNDSKDRERKAGNKEGEELGGDEEEGKEERSLRSEEKKKSEEVLENKPIKVDLVPFLKEQGTHKEFTRRGISKETCEYLGCGFLPESKSKLKERVVFQVRGVDFGLGNRLSWSPTILSHVGRATNEEQEKVDGKWWVYKGFNKSLEVYNFDKLFLDRRAEEQVKETGHVLIVEGCFDVAKLAEAGIFNVIGMLGSNICEEQLFRLDDIVSYLHCDRFLVWMDRDEPGKEGQEKGLQLLNEDGGFKAQGFDWNKGFESKQRGKVRFPDRLNDPCDFSVDQLQWLRKRKVI